MEKKLTFIGDYVGTIEEFFPGDGTYDEDGKVYTSKIGKLVLDKEKHIARVLGKTSYQLTPGKVILGEVTNIKKSVVIVNIKRIIDNFPITFDLDINAAIYISNVSFEFIDDLNNYFGIGDIVKAKVILQRGALIGLSTKNDYGVVLAFCKKCRNPLKLVKNKPNTLYCENCKREEKRKVAIDYGNIRL